ncbi:putative pectate lyase 3, partial [Mucuna pruriens]
MIIQLRQELLISSKTIEGRGANMQIKNGVRNNVNIHGIHIKQIVPTDSSMIKDSYNHFGLRTRSDGDDDAVSIFGAFNICINRISIATTIPNCHMTKHNDVMLLGARY